MKYALVTGAGNGLGYQTTKLLEKNGFTVFACDINIDNLKENKNKNILPVKMDVTDYQSIVDVRKYVYTITRKMDVVLNFAGINLMDSLIEGDIKDMERLININIMGMVRVNQIFFKLIKEANGRIINVGSECGVFPASPFQGMYAMSKYAINAYSDSLRRELNFIGIKVIEILPGSFKSKMHITIKESFKELVAKTKLYKEPIKNMGKTMNRELKNAQKFKHLEKAILDAIFNPKPKIKYYVKNSRNLKFLSMLSDENVDKLYLKALKNKKK